MNESILSIKSFDFSLNIIKVYKYLVNDKKKFILSKQLLRSATSIGANIREANSAQSRRDFLHKMNIALKEANETEYWIELLIKSEYFNEYDIKKDFNRCKELCKMLNSTVNTVKKEGETGYN